MLKLLIHVTTNAEDGEWYLPLLWSAVPRTGEDFWLSFWQDGDIESVTVDRIEHDPENGYIQIDFVGVRDQVFNEIDKTKVSEHESDVPWVHWRVRNSGHEFTWKPIPFFKSCVYTDA